MFEENACANILVAIDGSEHSMKAVDYAVSLADMYNPKLIAAHVSTIGGAIVNHAEKEKVDLIVIGTRSRLGIKKLLIGSVASNVLHYAHCPVMIVK